MDSDPTFHFSRSEAKSSRTHFSPSCPTLSIQASNDPRLEAAQKKAL